MKESRFTRLLFIAWMALLFSACTQKETADTSVLSVELLDQTEKGAKMEFNTRVTGLPIRAVHDK